MSFLYGTTSINHSPDLSIGLITGWDGKHIHHNVVNAPKKSPLLRSRILLGLSYFGVHHIKFIKAFLLAPTMVERYSLGQPLPDKLKQLSHLGMVPPGY